MENNVNKSGGNLIFVSQIHYSLLYYVNGLLELLVSKLSITQVE